MACHPFNFGPHMNVLFLNLLIQMGVLHHLEEVMSLPPPLSPPSPAGMWRLLPHLWCTEERRALSPSTVSVSTVSSRPKISSLPLFDMAICIFCVWNWTEIVLFVCQCWFDVVCMGPSRERCGAVCGWHCWWWWSLEGGEVSRHISDSCLWGFALMIQILQCSLCFTVAPQFSFVLGLCVWVFSILL